MCILEKYDHPSFAESVYGEPPCEGVFLCNWNNVPQHITNWLEKRGFECLWNDEYLHDYENNRVFRCEATHYGWMPQFICNDWTNYEVIGEDDLQDIADEYINEYLLNDPKVADHLLEHAKIRENGFEPLIRGENGLHAYQTDDPEKMMESAKEQYPNADFIFVIDSVGQFDTHFSLWKREREE